MPDIYEQIGKQIRELRTTLRGQGISQEDLAQAVARLPDLLKQMPNRDVRHKLTVESWNDEPITTTIGKELLEHVGFVRDYQAMTLYAVWQTSG